MILIPQYEDEKGNSCLFNLLLILLLGVSARLLYWLVSEFKTIMLPILIALLTLILIGIIYYIITNRTIKRKKLPLSADPDDPNFTIETPIPDDELLMVEDSSRPTMDLLSYKYPTLDLLEQYDPEDKQIDMAEHIANKNKITQTFNHFGIDIKSIMATVGQTVTLYEIVPEDGVNTKLGR